MFGFKKEDGFSWSVLAIIVMIVYFVFSDGKFSIIFTLAGTVQTFGFALIVIKIKRSRTVTGLPRETFLCYTLIFSIRAILFMIYKVLLRQFRDICLNCLRSTLQIMKRIYKVLLRQFRDICLTIQQEMSYSESNNSQQPSSQPTSSTASQSHTKSAIIKNQTQSSHTTSLPLPSSSQSSSIPTSTDL